jgi:hypothetical protein
MLTGDTPPFHDTKAIDFTPPLSSYLPWKKRAYREPFVKSQLPLTRGDAQYVSAVEWNAIEFLPSANRQYVMDAFAQIPRNYSHGYASFLHLPGPPCPLWKLKLPLPNWPNFGLSPIDLHGLPKSKVERALERKINYYQGRPVMGGFAISILDRYGPFTVKPYLTGGSHSYVLLHSTSDHPRNFGRRSQGLPRKAISFLWIGTGK